MEREKVQDLLKKYQLDAWVFTDYHGRDQLTKKLLNLPEDFFTSRRWFYIVPQSGQPVKIVSQIEKEVLSHLEGEVCLYTSFDSLKQILKEQIGCRRVAMQYVPGGRLSIISTVDAGIVELVKEMGAQVHSAGDLIQHLWAVLSKEDLKSHQRAGRKILAIRDEVYRAVRIGVESRQYLKEVDVLNFILRRFKEEGLTCEHDLPYVAVNDHAVHLTFVPDESNSYEIKEGDRLLLDLWAKEKKAGAVYYDVSFCAYVGETVPKDYKEQFEKAAGAREHAIAFIEKRLQEGKVVYGYEVDEVCRSFLAEKGEATYFLHRTGHNIGCQVHGAGANLDAFENIDERRLLPGTLFSIEPGIYKGEIGVRTEVDVYMDEDGGISIFGERQEEIYKI